MSTTSTLLIDADDTLWENNIYFERVAAAFFAKLAAHGVAEPQAQAVLWQTEQRNIQKSGYGSKAFCASLHEAAGELGVTDLEPWIAQQEQLIFHHPIEFMPGVPETLPILHARHRLIVVTKGHPPEQLGKLQRSGLDKFFHATEVVFEKNVATYRAIIAKHQLAVANSWMIGNSPRSDINPAKAAGLRTVFIPYHTTWHHEMEEIAPDGQTVVLSHFGELASLFK
jgi:putative hydrolase of the HAD superfamily